jgi:hypothetical protein
VRWWELDLTYSSLRVLSALGVVWDLRKRARKRAPRREGQPAGERRDEQGGHDQRPSVSSVHPAPVAAARASA